MKILVPLDGSRLSDAVVSHVRRLFHGLGGACEAHLLHVIDPAHPRPEGRAEARVHLGALARLLEQDGLRTVLRVVTGEPVAKILETAVDDGIDLIAMATHGRSGVRRWVWGSVAERVVRTSPASVFLVNPRGLLLTDDEVRYGRILLVLDEQGFSGGALGACEALSAAARAELTVLHPPSIEPEAIHGEAARRGLPVTRLAPVAAVTSRSILEAARERRADLVLLSGAPRSPLSPWPLEPGIDRIARLAPCPVLIARPGVAAAARARVALSAPRRG